MFLSTLFTIFSNSGDVIFSDGLGFGIWGS